MGMRLFNLRYWTALISAALLNWIIQRFWAKVRLLYADASVKHCLLINKHSWAIFATSMYRNKWVSIFVNLHKIWKLSWICFLIILLLLSNAKTLPGPMWNVFLSIRWIWLEKPWYQSANVDFAWNIHAPTIADVLDLFLHWTVIDSVRSKGRYFFLPSFDENQSVFPRNPRDGQRFQSIFSPYAQHKRSTVCVPVCQSVTVIHILDCYHLSLNTCQSSFASEKNEIFALLSNLCWDDGPTALFND